MKHVLVFAGMVMSSIAVAAPDYQSCTQDSRTDICQAYLAGLDHGKSAAEAVAVASNDSPFRARALEQRVGERYRKMTVIEQKPALSPDE